MTVKDYDSDICTYCRCTNYGESPSSYVAPNGYYSCEGEGCEEAYKNYKKEHPEDKRTLEEMF